MKTLGWSLTVAAIAIPLLAVVLVLATGEAASLVLKSLIATALALPYGLYLIRRTRSVESLAREKGIEVVDLTAGDGGS